MASGSCAFVYLATWNWASPEVKAVTLIRKYVKPARKKSQAALRELTAGLVSICPLFVLVPFTLTHGPVVGSSTVASKMTVKLYVPES